MSPVPSHLFLKIDTFVTLKPFFNNEAGDFRFFNGWQKTANVETFSAPPNIIFKVSFTITCGNTN